MSTQRERLELAHTILQQMGGNQFTAMTGAKNFIALEGGLSFQLPNARKANGVKYVRIELTPMDTYTVRFFGQKASGGEQVFDNTYCDQLRGLFEDVTGLRTSLGTMRVEDLFARAASNSEG